MGHARPSALRGRSGGRAGAGDADDLRRGSVFYDLARKEPLPARRLRGLDQGRPGHTLHRRLFVARADPGVGLRSASRHSSSISCRRRGTKAPAAEGLPERDQVEAFLYEQALTPFRAEVAAEREKENATVRKHIEISLGELINRQNMTVADLVSRQQTGDQTSGLAGNIKQASDHLEELNARLERRLEELEKERHCTIEDLQYLGRAWVLPHPAREMPAIAPMVRDEEIEKLAVQAAIRNEEARGWVVESVEVENRGFDLISRRPHPHDPKTFLEVRFIEVKGRAGVGKSPSPRTSTAPPSGSATTTGCTSRSTAPKRRSCTSSETLGCSGGSRSLRSSTTRSGRNRSSTRRMSESRRYPRRLIEVDLPIRRISEHARSERSSGPISTLHLWWARRPLAACRSVILSALLPEPHGPAMWREL